MPLNEKAVCAKKAEPCLGSLQSLQLVNLVLICSQQNWTNVFRGEGTIFFFQNIKN